MKQCILIVDDEPTIGLILEHYFSSSYHVVVKSNGKEAMNWLEEGHPIDAIVADFEMPFMNGLDFIRQLRASTLFKDIPLIMLSGKEESRNKILCLKSGADDYMIKPFNPEELEIRIKNVLKRVKIS
ncbi:response regulator transcription factor [Rufibacter glacialis]|uniref:Response regulator transcription factor n=1 Tax=Rufibacter glacialis TaxID=1259555 RepID=A0A5M8QSX9_9BACT|nr:response regulator transcription factor [Rufibacter glacialis]KAA6437736.1 response regulator transcription factor [Rufibacter glacialis]GGK56752.1 two-component system response regulator [Rufibacter glacialis]